MAQQISKIIDGLRAWNGTSYHRRKFPLLSSLKLASREIHQISQNILILTPNLQRLAKRTIHLLTGEQMLDNGHPV
jgi:hypothetical protein